MNNKNLKEFIEKLQTMALELDESISEETNTLGLEEESEQAVLVSEETSNDTNGASNSDSPNGKYFKITISNGTDIGDLSIGKGTILDVEVDYAGFLNANGFDTSYDGPCVFKLQGIKRNIYRATYSVYSKVTNQKYGPFENYYNSFYVDIKKLFKETGSADFRFQVDELGFSETFFYGLCEIQLDGGPVMSLTVSKKPDNLYFSEGSYFEATGINVLATYFDGTIQLTNEYRISPNTPLTSDDKSIKFSLDRGEAYLAITVIPDKWENDFKGYNYKELKLCDCVNGNLNLNTDCMVTTFSSFNTDDFILPINISHVHRADNAAGYYGAKWSMSLNKQLKLSQNDDEQTTIYTYIDELGDSYIFDEKYYIIENEAKKFISKDRINIDINGKLTYDSKPVYRLQSCNGYTLIPEINDFIDSEVIEQRHQEQIELEEYVKSVESSLKNYVVVSADTGRIERKMDISDRQNFQSSLSGVSETSDLIVLTENEALQIQSIYVSSDQLNKQKNQIDLQLDQITLQKRQIELQKKQVDRQITDLDNNIKLSKLVKPDDYNKQINFDIDLSTGSEAIISKINYQMSYASAKGNKDLLVSSDDSVDTQVKLTEVQKTLLDRQESEISAQRNLLETQISIYDKQINNMITQARSNFTAIKDVFNKYVSKKAELELMLNQTPVNFIRDNSGIISGFNAEGNFVLMFDAYNNYVNIEYDIEDRIKSIYDSNGKTMDFAYDSNLLKSITDSCGKTVKYAYGNGNLTTVTFADGSTVKFDTDASNITAVERCGNTRTEIEYNHKNCVTNVKVLSAPITISKNTEKVSDGFTQTLSSVLVEHGTNITTLEYDDLSSEVFTFHGSRRICAHSHKDSAGVEATTVYNYSYSTPDTKTVRKDTTYSSGYKTKTIETYNDIDLLICNDTDWMHPSKARGKNRVQYEYDINNNIIKEVNTVFTKIESELVKTTSYTNYFYDAGGKLTLTESYADGEELISGKNYREYIYDKNGNVVKTISWNSLDSSSKFYFECDYAENGQVVADKTETGENAAEYEYINGTTVINSVKYVNGSKLAYGRNPYNYNVTSLTQSTVGGESNTTDILYSHGLPVELKSGNTVINYEYDYKRRKTAVILNGAIYETYAYAENSDNYEITATNANCDVCKTVSDKQGNVLSLTCNGNLLVSNVYDVNGKLLSATDGVASAVAEYTYDSFDRLNNYTCGENSEQYEYNVYGQLIRKTLSGAVNRTYNYVYKDDAKSFDYTATGEYKFKPLTDVNGRNTGKEIHNATGKIAAEYISYRKMGDRATNMPSSVWYANGQEIKENIGYTYDKCGNISEIKENGALAVRYSYDGLNRLIREDNKKLGKTYLFDYDNNGNIISRRTTTFTLKSDIEECAFTAYEYGYNGDRLVSYNGESFAYNNMGNPTVYRGKTAEWQCGNRLVKLGETMFVYDGHGRRIKKGETDYIYDSDGRIIAQSNGLEFVYDNSGIVGVRYEEEQYFYRRDVQGDITAILDNSGAVVVRYNYDAWGNHRVVNANGEELTEGIGVLNPFRYRGYYYDTETGLYYLQTRYYDPETCRFISQDSIDYADPETINGLNLYAYCINDPVNNIDPTGTWSWKKFWAIVGAIAVVIAVTAATVLTAGAFAVALGATAAVTSVVMIGAGVGGVAMGAISIASQASLNGIENINLGSVAKSTFTGAAIGALAAGLIALGGGAGTGALALAGGGTISNVSAMAKVGAVGLGIVFSRYNMPYHGEPNSTLNHGSYTGQYDENGNLISRKDRRGGGHFISGYGKVTPHTHFYQWKLINGVWEIIKHFVMPF